jgi:hypothetical protein
MILLELVVLLVESSNSFLVPVFLLVVLLFGICEFSSDGSNGCFSAVGDISNSSFVIGIELSNSSLGFFDHLGVLIIELLNSFLVFSDFFVSLFKS